MTAITFNADSFFIRKSRKLYEYSLCCMRDITKAEMPTPLIVDLYIFIIASQPSLTLTGSSQLADDCMTKTITATLCKYLHEAKTACPGVSLPKTAWPKVITTWKHHSAINQP